MVSDGKEIRRIGEITAYYLELELDLDLDLDLDSTSWILDCGCKVGV